MLKRQRGPSETLRKIGELVGATPELPPDGWPSGAWNLRFDLAGRTIAWQTKGKEHDISWVTPDCAVGVTLGNAKRLDEPAFKTFKSGVSILVSSTPWTTTLEDEARAWLAIPGNVQVLESLPLDEREYTHFGWPRCTALLRDRGISDLDRVAALVAASDRLVDPQSRWLAEVARAQQATVRWKALPVEFRPLSRFSRQWGESDDQIRSDRMDRAPTAKLIELHAAASPLFDAFEAYADRVSDHPPEAYFRLERIFEAAAEAESELQRRGIPANSSAG